MKTRWYSVLFIGAVTAGLIGVGAVILKAQQEGSAPASAATFHKDVEPILQAHCQSCHRPGQIAPMSMLSYKDVRPWARSMKTKVLAHQMPPWTVRHSSLHFINDPSLTPADIETIAKWVDAGAPEGNPADAPKPVAWPADGWQIKPDVIVRGQPFSVPAHPDRNVIEWTNIYVPTGFTKDVWITSMEVKPSALDVTHHICIVFVPHRDDVQYFTPQWSEAKRDDEGVFVIPENRETAGQRQQRLARFAQNGPNARPQNPDAVNDVGATEACYLPGNSVEDYRPFGAAKLVPAGTDLRFQVHYTPSGKDTIDVPLVGFTVSDTPPAKRWISTSVSGTAGSPDWVIPPNDGNWKAPTGVTQLAMDVELAMMQPHEHLRGKDMTYTLEYPDGKKEVLLDARYDFNWQFQYYLNPTKHLPKGSKIYVDATYDNSINNKFNPNPNRPVYPGTMTWEEMMLPYVGIIVPRGTDPRAVFNRQTLTGPVEGGGNTRASN